MQPKLKGSLHPCGRMLPPAILAGRGRGNLRVQACPGTLLEMPSEGRILLADTLGLLVESRSKRA